MLGLIISIIGVLVIDALMGGNTQEPEERPDPPSDLDTGNQVTEATIQYADGYERETESAGPIWGFLCALLDSVGVILGGVGIVPGAEEDVSGTVAAVNSLNVGIVGGLLVFFASMMNSQVGSILGAFFGVVGLYYGFQGVTQGAYSSVKIISGIGLVLSIIGLIIGLKTGLPKEWTS